MRSGLATCKAAAGAIGSRCTLRAMQLAAEGPSRDGLERGHRSCNPKPNIAAVRPHTNQRPLATGERVGHTQLPPPTPSSHRLARPLHQINQPEALATMLPAAIVLWQRLSPAAAVRAVDPAADALAAEACRATLAASLGRDAHVLQLAGSPELALKLAEDMAAANLQAAAARREGRCTAALTRAMLLLAASRAAAPA